MAEHNISQEVIEYIYKYANFSDLNGNPKLDEIKKSMLEQAQNDEMSIMMTNPIQVRLLEFITKISAAKRVMEIGVFRGVTTLHLASVMPDDGLLYALDVTDKYLNDYHHYWTQAGVDKKIKLIIGDAVVTLKSLLFDHKGKFDLIYIDANKKSYLEYYELSYSLLKSGGIMLLDNMIQGGRVVDQSDATAKQMHNLNCYIANDMRISGILLPIGDGLYLIIKK